tara:strand:+ start:336 stop:725 length:390 start_codon:yes stop_codon:yes gene_type:complete
MEIILLLLLLLAAVFDSYQNNEIKKLKNTSYIFVKYYQTDKEGVPLPYDDTSWWYCNLYKPKFKERFIFSSTLLINWTDSLHLWASLKETTMIITLVIAYSDFTLISLLYILCIKIFMKGFSTLNTSFL